MSVEFGDPRLPARFWTKVEVNTATACWEWVAGLHTAGYGRYSLDGYPNYAHRVALDALVGPLAPGLVTDHLCRNRRCVNPSHLEAVPQRVNVLRGEAPRVTRERHAAKTHCVQGHELTDDNLTGGKRRRCRTCQNQAAANTRRRRASTDPATGEG